MTTKGPANDTSKGADSAKKREGKSNAAAALYAAAAAASTPDARDKTQMGPFIPNRSVQFSNLKQQFLEQRTSTDKISKTSSTTSRANHKTSATASRAKPTTSATSSRENPTTSATPSRENSTTSATASSENSATETLENPTTSATDFSENPTTSATASSENPTTSATTASENACIRRVKPSCPFLVDDVLSRTGKAAAKREKPEEIEAFNQWLELGAAPFARTTFSLCQKLLVQLVETKENHVISPMAIALAFSDLVYAGGFKNKLQLHKRIDLLSRETSDPEEKQVDIPPLFEFIETAASRFAANNFHYLNQFFIDWKVETEWLAPLVVHVNFSDDPGAAFERINELPFNCKVNWPVRDAIEKEKITQNTSVVFTNTCHFTGTWDFAVDAQDIEEHVFHVSSSELPVPTRMMTKYRVPVRYDEALGLKVCALPYAAQPERLFELVVFLPDDIDGLNELLNNLSSEQNSNLLPSLLKSLSLQKKKIIDKVVLPLFQLERTSDLKEPLKTLGITELFNEKSRLSGMSDARELFLSHFLHRPILEVSEGTCTSSSTPTSTTTSTSSACVSRADEEYEPLNKSFECDRPFLFLVRERPDSSKAKPEDLNEECDKPSFIYFVGTYRKP